MLCFYYAKRETAINDLTQTTVCRIFLHMFVFQLVSTAVLILNGSEEFYILVTVFIFFFIFTFVGGICWLARMNYSTVSEEMCDSEISNWSYEHPLTSVIAEGQETEHRRQSSSSNSKSD